jgi:hypothetical protein
VLGEGAHQATHMHMTAASVMTTSVITAFVMTASATTASEIHTGTTTTTRSSLM